MLHHTARSHCDPSPEAVHLDEVAPVLVHDQTSDDQLLVKAQTIHRDALRLDTVPSPSFQPEFVP